MPAFELDLRADIKFVLKDLDEVENRVVPGVAALALNRAMAKVRTDATRGISRRLNVKPAKIIRRRLLIRRASRRRLVGHIFAGLDPVPIMQTRPKPRQTAYGVRAGQRRIKSAFFATMPSGRSGIWRRTTKKRFPIKQESISIQDLGTRLIRELIDTVGAQTWRKEFSRLLAVKLAQKRA